MRKILLLLLVQLALSPAFGQKKPVAKTESAKPGKPTKEETMDWLAGKMQERLKAPRIFLSYSNGVFIYKKMYGATGDYCTTKIDLNKVTGINPEYSIELYVTGNGVLYTGCEGGHGNEYANEFCIGGNNYHDYSDPFDFRTDNILMERVQKAFKALVEFNGSKKGEGEAY